MALSGFDKRAYARLQLQYEQRNYKKLGSVAHQLKGMLGAAASRQPHPSPSPSWHIDRPPVSPPCAGMLGYITARHAQQTAARLEQSAKALAVSDGGAEFLQEEVREALRAMEAELQRVVPAVEETLDQLS